jgi:hypothetical protein
VSIDGNVIATGVDVRKSGEQLELAVNGLSGRELRIVPLTNDEVVVEGLEVRYSQGRGVIRNPSWGGSVGQNPAAPPAGGCIGGDECGGRDSVLRVALEARPLASVRFFAHDDVGNRSGGRLRVSIGGKVVESAIDVPKEGRDYALDVRGYRGRELVFEAVSDDEIVIERIEVRYR